MIFAYIDPGTGFTIFTVGGGIIAFFFGCLGIFSLFFKRIFAFFKKNWKFIIVILLVIVAGLIIRGAFMTTNTSTFDKKMVILGFDGLDPRIIETMMDKGELPNFARLRQEGSYRHLDTANPSQSPVAWTAFSTGQNPGKNGIFDFIIRDPKTYGLNLSLSNVQGSKAKRVIKTKCFWQHISERKVPTVIISCPVTFPPDKVYGRMLSGMGVPDILGTEGTFTFYTTEPINKKKDIGGTVFGVRRSDVLQLDLIGPRVARGSNQENIKVPFKVFLSKGEDKITIEHNNRKFELEQGQWSDWQEVSFKIDFFKKMKGIFKFYLVETRPEFKLYISPINFDPREPSFAISYPEDYTRELTENIGLFYTQGMPMDTWAVNEKRISEEPFLEQAREVFKEKQRMLDFELNRLENGVLFCYFESSDIIQHMFWRYTDKLHPLYEENASQEYKDIIRIWYMQMDDVLGKVLQKLGPEDTVLVLSDHGFDTFRRAVHVNSWLRKNKYLVLKDPGADSTSGLLQGIDWSKTRAYAIGFGAIYINQQGREAEGIVRPGEDSQVLKEEISARLTQWVDDKYASNVVNKVYKREEIFWGDYAVQSPDLYIGFNKGYRASWQTALGAVPKELIEDNLKKWSGSHLFDPKLIPGILFSNKKITRQDPSIYDITPTVLKTCGFDNSQMKELNLDGKPLF